MKTDKMCELESWVRNLPITNVLEARIALTSHHPEIDIHTQTAMEMTGKPADQITTSERNRAKSLNFFSLYSNDEILGGA